MSASSGRSGARRRGGERRAFWIGRTLAIAAIAALFLVWVVARAADVASLKVFGIGLGDDRSSIEEAFPGVSFEATDYADPVVGYAYEAALGRRAVDHFEGRGFRPVPGSSPTEFIFRLTGDGRLYELMAWQRFDGRTDCVRKIREWRNSYGMPDVQVLNERAQWIERDIGIERMLDIRCDPEAGITWQLIDAGALADYREVLRQRLRPYVEQVEIRTRRGYP